MFLRSAEGDAWGCAKGCTHPRAPLENRGCVGMREGMRGDAWGCALLVDRGCAGMRVSSNTHPTHPQSGVHESFSFTLRKRDARTELEEALA